MLVGRCNYGAPTNLTRNGNAQMNTTLKQALWEYLHEPDNLIRLETATYLRRPAVEPLSPGLLSRFGDEVRQDQVKQGIGRMVREIMEARGYRIDRQGGRITRGGNMFASGTRYIEREHAS
jgi:hypothetical protein